MTDLELERLLGSLPVRAPDAVRERELLTNLRTASTEKIVWWKQRIPLWQAAAACAAVFFINTAWLRDGRRPAASPESPVVIRVDHALFARAATAGEAIDVSRWQSLPAAPK